MSSSRAATTTASASTSVADGAADLPAVEVESPAVTTGFETVTVTGGSAPSSWG
jgi:hypothetical protein